MMLLGLTWEGVGLFTSVIVFVHGAKLLLDDYTLHDFLLYLCWLIPLAIGLLTLTRTYWGGSNYGAPFTTLDLGIPLAFAVLALGYVSLCRWPKLISRVTLNHRIPLGIGIVFVELLVLSGIIGCRLTFMTQPIRDWLFTVWNNFLSPMGQSRLMQTVAELTDTSLLLWEQSYAALFLCFSAGMLLSIFQLCRQRNWSPWLVMGTVEIVLMNIFYSNTSMVMPVKLLAPNQVYYFGSLLLLLAVILGMHFYAFWKLRSSGQSPVPRLTAVDPSSLLLMGWFLIMAFASRGAVRYHFFLAPPAAIYGAYALWRLYCWLTCGESPETLWIYILFAVVAWEGYVVFENSPVKFLSIGLALTTTAIGSAVTFPSLLKKIQNYQFSRAFGGIVFYALLVGMTSLMPAAGGFAKVSLEIARTTTPLASPALRNGFHWMRDNLPEGAIVAAAWEYGSMINVLSRRGTIVGEMGFDVKGAQAILRLPTPQREISLPLSKVFVNGITLMHKGDSETFPGGLIVFIRANEEQEVQVKTFNLWAIYLPDVGYNSLLVQLYLLNKKSPYFRQVYPEYDAFLPKKVKIWEIVYPTALKSNPEYLATEFKNPALYRTWMLGLHNK